jgi:hypothetical protein
MDDAGKESAVAERDGVTRMWAPHEPAVLAHRNGREGLDLAQRPWVAKSVSEKAPPQLDGYSNGQLSSFAGLQYRRRRAPHRLSSVPLEFLDLLPEAVAGHRVVVVPVNDDRSS